MKPRAKRTEIENHIIRTNLEFLLSEYGSKKVIAELCGVSPSTVTKWISFKDFVPPSDKNLEIIASHYSSTVNWIKTDHSLDSVVNKKYTYAEILFAMLPTFISGGIIIQTIKDPILGTAGWELWRTMAHQESTPEQKTEILQKISRLYDIPYPITPLDVKLLNYIQNNVVEIINTDKLVEYSNLAKYITDPSNADTIDQFRRFLYGDPPSDYSEDIY